MRVEWTVNVKFISEKMVVIFDNYWVEYFQFVHSLLTWVWLGLSPHLLYLRAQKLVECYRVVSVSTEPKP